MQVQRSQSPFSFSTGLLAMPTIIREGRRAATITALAQAAGDLMRPAGGHPRLIRVSGWEPDEFREACTEPVDFRNQFRMDLPGVAQVSQTPHRLEAARRLLGEGRRKVGNRSFQFVRCICQRLPQPSVYGTCFRVAIFNRRPGAAFGL